MAKSERGAAFTVERKERCTPSNVFEHHPLTAEACLGSPHAGSGQVKLIRGLILLSTCSYASLSTIKGRRCSAVASPSGKGCSLD